MYPEFGYKLLPSLNRILPKETIIQCHTYKLKLNSNRFFRLLNTHTQIGFDSQKVKFTLRLKLNPQIIYLSFNRIFD